MSKCVEDDQGNLETILTVTWLLNVFGGLVGRFVKCEMVLVGGG